MHAEAEELNTSLWRISSPATSPTLSVYATLPSAPNANIAFAPNGTIYVWDNSQAVQVTGTSGPNPPVVTSIPSLSLYYLGLLAYGSQTNGDAQFLIANLPANTSVNPNVPTTTSVVDLTTSPPTVGATIIANGGGGNMINGPDGCIYMSLGGGGVWKITDTTGACKYTGTPAPSISLTPTTLASNPQQGTSQTFKARFHNVSVPDGTSVLLNVTGANTKFVQASTVGGAASLTYTGTHQGVDTITASATVSSSPLVSNQSVITWGPGSDVTFLTLNGSPSSAAPSQYGHRDREPDGSIGDSSSGSYRSDHQLHHWRRWMRRYHRQQRQRLLSAHAVGDRTHDAGRQLHGRGRL